MTRTNDTLVAPSPDSAAAVDRMPGRLPLREPAEASPGNDAHAIVASPQGVPATALVAIGAALAWIVACYWTTAEAIVGTWMRSDTFAHGFVVPPIVGWLIWRKRAALRDAVVQPKFSLLAVVALCGAAWLAGALGAVNSVAQLAFALILISTVPVILGVRFASVIAFPLAFLLFAVPIGEFAMPRLMQWTADFTVVALRASGVPVYREGLLFVIPSGTWSVVEACSGVRYLIASLMVGTLYAYLTYTSLRRRLAFMAVALVVPIVANWLRAYMIVMIGHVSSNQLAVGVDHLIYGWIFFGLVMALMFFIGSRWEEAPIAAGASSLRGGQGAWHGEVKAAPSSMRAIGIAAALMAVIAGAFPAAEHAIRTARPAVRPQLVTPAVDPAWQPLASDPIRWRPEYQAPSAEYQALYRKGDATVGLFIAYYRNQNQAIKLVSSENVLVKSVDARWLQVGSAQQPVALGSESVRANAATLRDSSGLFLDVRQWYWIDGHLTSNEYLAKAYTALGQLLGHGDDAAAVIVYAPAAGPGAGTKALDEFLQANGPAISQALTETRQGR